MRYGTWRGLPQYASGVRKWDYGRAVRPRAVFVHIMEGHLAGTDSWFRNPASGTTSTHFGIGFANWFDRTIGKVSTYQWVDTANTAYGTAVTRYPVSPLAKSVLGDLIGRIDVNHAIIHIEVEGYPYRSWHPGFVRALNALLDALRWHGPLYVMRHNDVSSKVCPGTATPWSQIRPTYGRQLGVPASLPDTSAPKDELPLRFKQIHNRKFLFRKGTTWRSSPKYPASNAVQVQSADAYYNVAGYVPGSSLDGSNRWVLRWRPIVGTTDQYDGRWLYAHYNDVLKHAKIEE